MQTTVEDTIAAKVSCQGTDDNGVWRTHIRNAMQLAQVSDKLVADVKSAHQRWGHGTRPVRETIEQVLEAMENQNMFGVRD